MKLLLCIIVNAIAVRIFSAHDWGGIVGHGYCEDKSTEHIKHNLIYQHPFFFNFSDFRRCYFLSVPIKQAR